MLVYIEMEITHLNTEAWLFLVCSWWLDHNRYSSLTSLSYSTLLTSSFVLDDSSSNQPGIGWNICNSSFLPSFQVDPFTDGVIVSSAYANFLTTFAFSASMDPGKPLTLKP